MTDFERLVRQMRHNQVQFFKSRENKFLVESKRLEKMVDAYLAEKEQAEKQPGIPGLMEGGK